MNFILPMLIVSGSTTLFYGQSLEYLGCLIPDEVNV
jgi:hypothetical protein